MQHIDRFTVTNLSYIFIPLLFLATSALLLALRNRHAINLNRYRDSNFRIASSVKARSTYRYVLFCPATLFRSTLVYLSCVTGNFIIARIFRTSVHDEIVLKIALFRKDCRRRL